MDSVRFHRSYTLPATPETLWPILADTERLNRQIGLPPTRAEVVPGCPLRLARMQATLHGLAMRWEEEPFEFVEPRYYWVRRRLTAGPIREFNGGMRFVPNGSGTDIHVESELLPAHTGGRLIIHGLLRKTAAEFDRLMEGLRSHLSGDRQTAFDPGVALAPENVQRTTRQALQSVDAELRAEPLFPRLAEHLATADDLRAVRIRPFTLAREWGADRYAALALCLKSASAGVLDSSWDLLCPNCRGATNRWRSLDGILERAHCEDCQITFNANFDRAVELTFRPNARYREVQELVYCSGGPRNTPHVIAQVVLGPGEGRLLDVALTEGRYRLRNLTADLAAWLHPDSAASASDPSAVLDDDGIALDPEDGLVSAGDISLRLENRSGTRQQVLLERVGDTADSATAAIVTMFQEWRDLFGKEALSPDAQLGIQTLPLLFTDLKGSTDLYRQLGDASAYGLVRDHFQLLRNLVSRHGGGVVKTIGDAVMAAFPTPAAALACALEINGELTAFNQTARQPIRLKIGLHAGPCIAVRSYDDRLDYFGSTVNIAARTHAESHGDDVVVTAALLRDPEAAKLVVGSQSERFTTELRGIGQMELIRIYPQS